MSRREHAQGPPVDRSQRREFTQDMHRSSGGYELALSPFILALIGFGLDWWLGTTPILTIMAAVIGLGGAVTKLYYTYNHDMDRHDTDAPWSRGDG
jgi:hypothetical protein